MLFHQQVPSKQEIFVDMLTPVHSLTKAQWRVFDAGVHNERCTFTEGFIVKNALTKLTCERVSCRNFRSLLESGTSESEKNSIPVVGGGMLSS